MSEWWEYSMEELRGQRRLAIVLSGVGWFLLFCLSWKWALGCLAVFLIVVGIVGTVVVSEKMEKRSRRENRDE